MAEWSRSEAKTKDIIISWIAEHILFSNIRKNLYKLAGVKIGKGASIGYGVQIFGNPKNITIKEKAEVNRGVYFHAREKIVIGKNTAISPFVKLITSANPNAPDNELRKYYSPIKRSIIIADNVWVGTGAIILPGVTIGEMSIVAAGAVCQKDVPPFTVVGGVPAKVIKHLDKAQHFRFFLKTRNRGDKPHEI